MAVFTPEFSSSLRRVLRRIIPFTVLLVAGAAGLLVTSIFRHRARLRRGEVREIPRRRTRIAPLP
jgi:hypothetical protein